MLDIKKLSDAMDILTGRVKIISCSVGDRFGVDEVCSIPRFQACWLESEIEDGDVMIQKWTKNGVEINDESELTDNRIILPMSQWEEEV